MTKDTNPEQQRLELIGYLARAAGRDNGLAVQTLREERIIRALQGDMPKEQIRDLHELVATMGQITITRNGEALATEACMAAVRKAEGEMIFTRIALTLLSIRLAGD